MVGGPEKGRCWWSVVFPIVLLRTCVFCNSLSALRDSMLGQLPRKQEPYGSLDLPGGDGGSLVVMGKPASFSSNSLEEVVDKGVHDAHGFGGDTSVRVDLLQDFVDVDSIGLLSLPLPSLLLVSFDRLLRDLFRLGSSLS